MKDRLAYFLGIVLTILLVSGCGRQVQDKVVMVKKDDPKMNAAIAKACETARKFIGVLNDPQPNQSAFSVKMEVDDGKQAEFMWLAPVQFDGQMFVGTLANDAELVHNVKIGQRMTVAPDKISDWMYVEDGKLVGGFTIRAMRDAMPDDERSKLDSELPFRVE